MIKSLTIFVVTLMLSVSCYAQNNYSLSTPTGLKETGLNKVLCMQNGNTMLFHFEPAKDIIIKVFDSTHKEIASVKQSCRLLDLYIIKDAVFKGLFEINGEAVLFIEQEHLSRYGLVRLRFNGVNGKLTEEKLVGESKSVGKHTSFYTMKNKDEDSYAILFATDVPQFLDCRIYVAYYNNKHESIKEVPIDVDRKKYDYLRVVSASIQPNGICVSLSLAKLKENGTVSNISPEFGTPNIYDHRLYIYYIAKDSTKPLSTSLDVSTDVFPYYANYTYNPFARTVNLLLFSYKEVVYKFGLQWLPAALMKHIFFRMDEQDMALDYKWVTNKLVTKLLQDKTDTGKAYDGIPVSMFTNENGLTTLISTSYSRYSEPENSWRYNLYTYLGNIGITQLDDDGKELWGTLLPFSQRFMSHHHYYNPYPMANKAQTQSMFADLPEQVYDRQFTSVNCYKKGRDIFIVYNGNDNDIDNLTIGQKKDTVYNLSLTNACYYKLNSKKEVSKHYLFGTPQSGEYKSSFAEGADFDDKRGIYASLVQYRKGDDVSLCMAWSHLE